jgi:hypothetical protein
VTRVATGHQFNITGNYSGLKIVAKQGPFRL